MSAFVEGVAEGAFEVAATETYEYGRCARPKAFALERVENFVDLHVEKIVSVLVASVGGAVLL